VTTKLKLFFDKPTIVEAELVTRRLLVTKKHRYIFFRFVILDRMRPLTLILKHGAVDSSSVRYGMINNNHSKQGQLSVQALDGRKSFF
jgi:hypothetical protein